MINILLIEDHEIIRDGVKALLQKARGLHLIGSTSFGKTGVQIAQEQHPEIVILDYALPDINGLEVTRQLVQRNPNIKVLIITANKSAALALKFFEAGAAGYLSKDHGFSELERAIRTVKNGQRYISFDMASVLALRKVQSGSDASPTTPFDELSSQEIEIALLLSNGLSSDEAAQHLNLPKKTVHNYQARIYKKLNVKNNLALLQLALKHNLINTGQ